MKITKSTFFGQNSERDIGMGEGGGEGISPPIRRIPVIITYKLFQKFVRMFLAEDKL